VVRRVIRERIKSVSEKEKKRNAYNWRKRGEKEEKSERTLRTKNAAVGFQKNNLR
jgi:hypothetical protein